MLRFLVFCSAFSSLFLARFGIQITNDFSLLPAFIFLYLAIFVGLINGNVGFCAKSSFCYALFCFSGVLSYLYGGDSKSLTSLFLLFFTYLPIALKQRFSLLTFRDFSLLYLRLIFICCLFGLTQFSAQFFIQTPWLFDFRDFIPSFLQNKNPSNTVISMGGFNKSNGFFLTEPSGFSQWCSYGIFFTINQSLSLFYVLFLVFGLICSFSGTGLILVIFIFFFTFLKGNLFQRFLAISGSLIIFLFLLFIKPDFLSSRIEEFRGGTQLVTSSASARFLNPVVLIRESLLSSLKAFLLGNGPGSIQRVQKDFEAHDPTYAKLLFEYGLLGFFIYNYMFLIALTCKQNLLFTLLLFIQITFLGGNLLSLNNLSLPFLYILFVKK